MDEYKHITIFDKPYSMEKQAEGMAVHHAVAEGHCNECGFLGRCSADTSFRPPFFAWCAREKSKILEELKNGWER